MQPRPSKPWAPAATAAKRKITLTVDLLIPGWISTNPGLAGINFDGTRSTDFASVTALTTGPVGERLVEFVAEVTKRYRPDAVALTELMFDNNTYGGDDRDSYMLASGATDWPRLANGDIDVEHPSIASWRSGALASVVARAAAAAHSNGATLDMDVRAPWDDPAGDRPESGHDYTLLASAADRLVLWNYFGLNDKEPGYSAELARAMAKRAPASSPSRWGCGRRTAAFPPPTWRAGWRRPSPEARPPSPSRRPACSTTTPGGHSGRRGPSRPDRRVVAVAFVFPFAQRMS